LLKLDALLLCEVLDFGRDLKLLHLLAHNICQLLPHVIQDFTLTEVNFFFRMFKSSKIFKQSTLTYSDLIVQLLDWYLFWPKPFSKSASSTRALYQTFGSIPAVFLGFIGDISTSELSSSKADVPYSDLTFMLPVFTEWDPVVLPSFTTGSTSKGSSSYSEFLLSLFFRGPSFFSSSSICYSACASAFLRMST